MTDIVIANDIGTTQVKSICVYKKRPHSSNRVEYKAVLGESKELIAPEDDLMEVTTDDGVWFVADSAEEHSNQHIWGRGNGWALSVHYRAMHLYSIAKHIGNSTKEVNVDLISALPRADYGQREDIEAFLEGTHTVKTPDREKPLVVNINRVYFAIQGLAAIMAEGYTKGKIVVWLGLGGRNKTYATINKAGRPDPNKTNSSEGGLLGAVDELESIVGQEFDIELPKQGWIQALQDKSIVLGDGPRDISKQCQQALEPYFDTTLSLIRNVWNERSVMPFVSDFRIGGGGALEIGDRIAEKYKPARVVGDPRWTEAQGLFVLGKARYL